MQEGLKRKKCSAYHDREYCIGGACVWYDSNSHNCFINSPSVQPQRSWKAKSRLEMAGKRQRVYNIIHRLHQMNVKSLFSEVEKEEISRKELKEILGDLENRGLVFSPKPGIVGCVDD